MSDTEQKVKLLQDDVDILQGENSRLRAENAELRERLAEAESKNKNQRCIIYDLRREIQRSLVLIDSARTGYGTKLAATEALLAEARRMFDEAMEYADSAYSESLGGTSNGPHQHVVSYNKPRPVATWKKEEK